MSFSKSSTAQTLNVLAVLACGALLWPSAAAGQARQQARAPKPAGSLWVSPYIGAGFQTSYYDDAVVFSDGSSEFLTVDPGTGVLLGLQLGYRFSPKWTLHLNASTSSPNAEYVENLTRRPDNNLRTTQIDAGLLYDLAAFQLGRDKAPFSVGGGVTMTSHSLKQFTWDGNAIRPRTTSLGLHGLAALEIPLASQLNFRGQAKMSVTPLSLGDLEQRIAAAEGGGVTASLNAGTSTAFQMTFGVAYRP